MSAEVTAQTVIRASSLPSYADCALRWAATTMRAEIHSHGWKLRDVPRSIGATNGTAVHKAAAVSLTNKMTKGDAGAVEEAEAAGMEELDKQLDETETLWDSTTKDRNEAQKQVARQTLLYHATVVPQIQPIAVEEHLKATIAPGYQLSGHIDVSEELDLHDLKTGRNQRANAAQYGAYALLRRSNGQKARNLIEDYVRRVSKNTAQPQSERVVYEGPRAEMQAQQIIKRIVRDVHKFRETLDPWAFLPNPNSYLCGDKFCSAWGTDFCQAWRPKS